jgi:hypothetical protein
VIEGLRVLPRLQDARREKDSEFLMCERCSSWNDEATRIDMGCGLLPRAVGARPGSVPLSHLVPGLTACPGYTAELPDVLDVASCYLHWTKQSLAARLGTPDAAPALMDGLEVLHVAVEEFQSAKLRERTNGGL